MTAEPGRPGTPALYTNKWTRPAKCDCAKVPYRNETAALAAADRQRERFDVPFRAYKCPGTSRWHLSTRGFRPEALKSRPRILAWHLTARQVITRDALLRECGLDPTDPGSNPAAKARTALRIFAQLGLVSLDDPRRGYIRATDYEGLRRVMMVGLDEYAASHGMRIRR